MADGGGAVLVRSRIHRIFRMSRIRPDGDEASEVESEIWE